MTPEDKNKERDVAMQIIAHHLQYDPHYKTQFQASLYRHILETEQEADLPDTYIPFIGGYASSKREWIADTAAKRFISSLINSYLEKQMLNLSAEELRRRNIRQSLSTLIWMEKKDV